MNSERFLRQLVHMRTERGLGLRQAARHAKIGAATLSDWEAGRSKPNPATFSQYSKAMGFSDEERASCAQGLRMVRQETSRQSIGFLLLSLRARRGLPLRRVAELTGVKASTVHRWERGEATPSPDHLERVLTVLDPRALVAGPIVALLETNDQGLPFVLPEDPEEELPQIFDRPTCLYELQLAGLEYHARRRALEDPRWWDWLARFQRRAIGGFLANGAREEAFRWASLALDGHPGTVRHPELKPALFVFREVSAASTPSLAERSAKRLLRHASGNPLEGNAQWARFTAARKWGQAGCATEALGMLAALQESGMCDFRSFDGIGFRAAVLVSAHSAPAAIHLTEGCLGEIERRCGPHGYEMLWIRSIHLAALCEILPQERALEEIHEYVTLTRLCGDMGERWERRVVKELPHRLRTIAQAWA